VLLSRINVIEGRLQYGKLGVEGSDFQIEQINLRVSQAAQGGAFRAQGDAVAQPGNVKLVIREASLTPSGARSLAEMTLRGTMDVQTNDVAPLGRILLARPAGAGAMKGQLEISGMPARLTATGVLRFDRLTLSEERPQCEPRHRQLAVNDLRVPLAYSGTSVDSVPLQAKLANGSVALRLAVALG